MDIDLKQLKALLQLCRKQGVTEIKLSGVEFKLGEIPIDNRSQQEIDANEVVSDNPYANFPDGILTPEQLMYYSSGGVPENDPFIKDKAQ